MPVVYEQRDHIGIVTLSRPTARNAWGADFNEGLERHFDAMEEDDDIRCAVLTGDESGGRAHQEHPEAEASRVRGARRLSQAAGRGGASHRPGPVARAARQAHGQGAGGGGARRLVDLYRFAALELTEDKAEGHRAWREKRKPAFRGR